MFNKIKINKEIFALGVLVILTIIFTSYYNYTKIKITNNYKNIIENLYFKKSLNYFFDNLEPKYKKISHKVTSNESLSSILENYLVDKSEIEIIRKKLTKKIDLNKLKTGQKIHFTIDQSNNLIKEFVYQISNKERILLTRSVENNSFNHEIILTQLRKKTIYKENIILNSLYKSASDQKIPANTIIEFRD